MTGDLSSTPLRPLDAIKGIAGTDVGKKRQNNEDSYLIVEAADFKSFLIADGMGGARGGKTASGLAVSTFESQLLANPHVDVERILEAYGEANKAIFEKGVADPELEGMGTTLVSLTFVGTSLYIANVGDSRVYRIRNNRIALLTEDHTLVMELLRSGAINPSQVRNHPVSHMLTRSLGPTPQVEADCRLCEDGPARGDIYIVCSDGLHNGVTPDEMLEIAKCGDPARMVTDLIDLANKKGGADNITTIVIEIAPEFPVDPDEFDDDREIEIDLGVGGIFPERITPLSPNGYTRSEPIEKPARGSRSVGKATILGFIAGGLFAVLSYSALAPTTDPLPRTPREPEERLAIPLPEERSAVTMLLETPAPEPTFAPARAELPPLPERMGSIGRAELEAQLESLDRRGSWLADPSSAGERASETAEEIERLKGSMEETATRLESANRRLAYWIERGQESAGNEAAAVVSEVAVLSREVKDKKDAFERATWEYLEEAETLKYVPGDAAQQKKVEELAGGRKRLLDDLNESIRQAVDEIQSQIRKEIADLNLVKEAANARLKVMYSDLEFVKLLERSDASTLERLEAEIARQRKEIQDRHREEVEKDLSGSAN